MQPDAPADVHFRNVSGQLPRYSEVFIDDGYVDMKKAMSIYERCGFAGTVVPDHTPRLEAADRIRGNGYSDIAT